MRSPLLAFGQAALLALTPSVSLAQDAKIASAMAAAPPAVGAAATVIDIGMDGTVTELRKGTNGFTCLPDNPQSPGEDPMCVDANGLEWVMAWVSKSEPPQGKIGFGYMLMGGSDASNTDPFATEPKGAGWVETGPHIMIFNTRGVMDGYPAQQENPDTAQPYVMWAGTPYEHLMVPVR